MSASKPAGETAGTRALLLIGLLAACGLQSKPDSGRVEPDAGTDDAGPHDAGLGFDAGEFVRGDAGAWRFADISVQTTSLVEHIHGGGDALYATTAVGEIYRLDRLDGGTWQLLYDVSGFSRLGDLHVTDGGWVFAAGDQLLHRCRRSCADAGSWKSFTKMMTALTGVCGRGTTVYATGYDVLSGYSLVFQYDAALDIWPSSVGLLDLQRAQGCAIGPDGTLFLAGRRQVVELAADGGLREVDLTGSDMFSQWRTIVAVGDEVVVAGDLKRIARRAADGGWALVAYAPAGDVGRWWAAAHVGGGTVVLGGSRGNAGAFATLESTTLTGFPEPVGLNIGDLWTEPGLPVFVVAHPEDAGAAVIYRATR